MVQPTYPGVYVEEVPSGVRTITAVSTSIAAFLGRASKGPIDQAVRLLSYADYERRFGAPHPNSDLARSVRMFFNNGGSDCYVVRLARQADAATVTLHNLSGDPVFEVAAKARGAWGNNVRLEIDYDTQYPDKTFNLRVMHEENGSVVQSEAYTGLSMDPNSPRFAVDFVNSSTELVQLTMDASTDTGQSNDIADINNSFAGFAQSRRPLGPLASVRTALDGLINPAAPADTPQSRFEISVDGSSYVEVDLAPWSTADINAANLSQIRNRFRDRINDALDTVSTTANVAVTTDTSSNFLTFTADGGSSSLDSVHVRRASSRDIAAALMLGVDQGGVELTRYSNYRPAPTASLLTASDVSLVAGNLDHLNQLTGLQALDIASITINTETIQLDDPLTFNVQTTGTGTHPFSQSAVGYSPGTGENDGVREKLQIIANAINANTNLDYEAEVWGYNLALLSTSGTMNEQPATVSTTTTDLSGNVTINTRQYTLGDTGTSTFSTAGTLGSDGLAPDLSTYLGSAAQQTGMHALDPVDLINLMVLPGDAEVTQTTMDSLWGPASTYCSQRRAFLLVDPPLGWTDNSGRPAVVQDTSRVNQLRGTMVKTHSAVFYPRLKYSDNGVVRNIGPTGAIAGLFARTDSTRGVWKAPAGIEAGVRDIVGLNVELTDAENGVLNKKGVNCLRVLPNGIVNWGARTLDGDDDFGSEWKYVPIRRLALMIEESLYRGTRWAVFEPNDEPLWANLRLNVGAFMNSLFRQGAFQGATPKDAYYVRCDSTTTTQNDRDRGIVNVEVGFAPLKPAEFVIIKIQQIAGEIQT
jgi:phage tail sheath protein FI